MTPEIINVANQAILESCPSSLLRLDTDGNILSVSHDLCEIAGIHPASCVGKTAASLSAIMAQLLQSKQSIEVTSANGQLLYFNHTVMDDGQAPGSLHVFTNISAAIAQFKENQRLKEESKQLQLVDQDTSLLTKRALLLILEAQVARCRRYETPLSVIMLDVNISDDNTDMKFKLQKISRMLKDQLRWSDMVSRSDHKQFTIILPETERQACISLVNKVKDTIEKWNEDFSISLGFTEWEKGVNAADMLSLCEQNLQERIGRVEQGQDVA